MEWIVDGLPIHPLLVHFVVIVVPLAALCAVLSVLWPAARHRLGIVTPLVALAALIAVPITAEAGEALEEQIAETSLSEAHTEIGGDLLPWAIALFALAALQWGWFRFFTGDGRWAGRVTSATVSRVISIVLIVAVVAVGIGSVVEIVLIGESGARAVWDSRLG